jgi:hypothetical protein
MKVKYIFAEMGIFVLEELKNLDKILLWERFG